MFTFNLIKILIISLSELKSPLCLLFCNLVWFMAWHFGSMWPIQDPSRKNKTTFHPPCV